MMIRIFFLYLLLSFSHNAISKEGCSFPVLVMDFEGNDEVLKVINDEKEYISLTNETLNLLTFMSKVLIEQGEIESTQKFMDDLIDEIIYDYSHKNISTALESSFISYCSNYGGKEVFEMLGENHQNCYSIYDGNEDFENIIKIILNRQTEYLASLKSLVNSIPQCTFNN